MADFRFKDLTVDNAFDFCEVLAVIGVEQVIGAFDKDEIQQLQESGTDMKRSWYCHCYEGVWHSDQEHFKGKK